MRLPLIQRHFPVATLALLAVLAGCSVITGPDESRRVGVIDFHDQPVEVAVPDTVSAGVDFEVSAVTYGGGCVSADDTEVEVDGLFAQVVPYDLHRRQEACPDVLRTFEHRALVRFDEPGTAEVRVVGRREPGNSLAVVVRQVVVEAAPSGP